MIIQPLDPTHPKRWNIATTAAGAGVNATATVPANRVWELMHVYIGLTSDATAVNRTMVLRIENDGGVGYAMWPAAFSQSANLTYYYNYCPGIGRSARAGAYTYNIEVMPANILLYPGWVFETAVQGLQAGDNIGAFRYIYKEWILPNYP